MNCKSNRIAGEISKNFAEENHLSQFLNELQEKNIKDITQRIYKHKLKYKTAEKLLKWFFLMMHKNSKLITVKT